MSVLPVCNDHDGDDDDDHDGGHEMIMRMMIMMMIIMMNMTILLTLISQRKWIPLLEIKACRPFCVLTIAIITCKKVDVFLLHFERENAHYYRLQKFKIS